MSQVRSWILAVAGGCTVLAAGCGSGLARVKGIVTLDGKPLPNASVQFISQEVGGRDASGFTDASGVFELSTYRPRDGALPGLYKVTVHYSEPVKAPPDLKSAAAVQKATTKAAAAHKASVVIPAVYSRPDKTILKLRVPTDGDVKLELESTKR